MAYKKLYLQTWNMMIKETRELSKKLEFDYYDFSNIFNKTSETIFNDVVHFQGKKDINNFGDDILIKNLETILNNKISFIKN